MRKDKPVLMCDRCATTTDDLNEMAGYITVEWSTMSGHEEADICPECFKELELTRAKDQVKK
ncbi:hypothetical protein SEA_SURVIVORS_58 [Gordonia phage Survivors]|nr:hypothetical protein SEA_SURVIVORS_58 [Gordonia phage Survivors]